MFVINAMMALLSLYLYELLSYVVMPCCICTYRAYCVYVIGMLGMCGIRQPSCLPLVAYLMGKCLLVLPLSLGSLLLLRNS